ncbi:WXG100 family type VII secretion target [Mesorhizobium japonicum]|uniref:WXG100 family type VII secretion target n=1 Tax=Mesorhizobium japonicum TaxID=2066070 RepID=UPI003B5B78D0
MALDVNVSYDHLEQVAKGLIAGQGEIESQLGNLKKQVDELVNSGFITDQSSKAFEASYAEFNEGISKTVNGLEGLSAFLTKAASTFRESDQSLAQGLKG